MDLIKYTFYKKNLDVSRYIIEKSRGNVSFINIIQDALDQKNLDILEFLIENSKGQIDILALAEKKLDLNKIDDLNLILNTETLNQTDLDYLITCVLKKVDLINENKVSKYKISYLAHAYDSLV